MSKPIIELNNISKRYRLGNIGVGSLIDDLKEVGKKIGLPCNPPDSAKQFLALDNISFSVEEGEVLGLIGHNGAGKSTLLKILSRITEPTSGSAVLRGRVASLLEVGTGFHGEMTGRENIFLNGALYGLNRVEIKKQLDSIIDFSEVEHYIDTPVKRYSSGMYVRLAFAVAAHLHPEILIVDEVLAVGDAEFQNKCIKRMEEIRDEGKTIIIVSHQMHIIHNLCSQSILLKNGKIDCFDRTEFVIDRYLNLKNRRNNNNEFTEESYSVFTGEAKITHAYLINSKNRQTTELFYKEKFNCKIRINVFKRITSAVFSITVTTFKGERLIFSDSLENGRKPIPLDPGIYEIHVSPQIHLLPGTYSFMLNITHQNGDSVCCVERAIDFDVNRLSLKKERHYKWSKSNAYASMDAEWKLDYIT